MVLPSNRLDAVALLSEENAAEILAKVTPYSMVHESGIRFAMEAALYAIEEGIEGEIVECGSWRGGCAFAMLLAQRARYGEIRRRVHLMDSFEGLPPVEEKDGPLAAAWQDGADPEKFFDNCRAARQDVAEAIEIFGFSDRDICVWEGWFKDTLPDVVREVAAQGVCVLRLDGDWYEATIDCLNQLEPHTNENGVIIVDDYYAWDGCARATHDYLSANAAPYRIKSLPYNFGAFMIKQKARTSFEEF